MNIVVIDAQGGGIGKSIVEQLKKALPEQKLIAIGTNTIATAAMMRAGADQGATGENAIRVTAAKADIILGPIGLVLCDAMLGEITAVMACAVGSSPARKILIPNNRCQVYIAGNTVPALSDAIADAVKEVIRIVRG